MLIRNARIEGYSGPVDLRLMHGAVQEIGVGLQKGLYESEMPKEERVRILDDSFRGKLHPYVLNFLKILTEKGYMRHFSDCCKAFEESYNTYYSEGLPPGPICNPGMDAIKAALYPEDTNYFFFAHDNKGNIYLSENLNGHKNNLVKIIKANNSN